MMQRYWCIEIVEGVQWSIDLQNFIADVSAVRTVARRDDYVRLFDVPQRISPNLFP